MNRNVLVSLVIIVVLSVMALVIFSGGPATDVGSPKAPSPPPDLRLHRLQARLLNDRRLASLALYGACRSVLYWRHQ
jgi:hypothetical protein